MICQVYSGSNGLIMHYYLVVYKYIKIYDVSL